MDDERVEKIREMIAQVKWKPVEYQVDDPVVMAICVSEVEFLLAKLDQANEMAWALQDCIALLNAVDEQSGAERMKQFRVDPYGTIADGIKCLATFRAPAAGGTNDA